MPEFKVHSPYEPSGGQPEVIDKLSKQRSDALRCNRLR